MPTAWFCLWNMQERDCSCRATYKLRASKLFWQKGLSIAMFCLSHTTAAGPVALRNWPNGVLLSTRSSATVQTTFNQKRLPLTRSREPKYIRRAKTARLPLVSGATLLRCNTIGLKAAGPPTKSVLLHRRTNPLPLVADFVKKFAMFKSSIIMRLH